MSTNLMYTEPEAAPRLRMSAGADAAHAFGPAGRLLPGTSVACGTQGIAVSTVYKSVFPGVRAWSPPV
jgi:hypothetical protein